MRGLVGVNVLLQPIDHLLPRCDPCQTSTRLQPTRLRTTPHAHARPGHGPGPHPPYKWWHSWPRTHTISKNQGDYAVSLLDVDEDTRPSLVLSAFRADRNDNAVQVGRMVVGGWALFDARCAYFTRIQVSKTFPVQNFPLLGTCIHTHLDKTAGDDAKTSGEAEQTPPGAVAFQIALKLADVSCRRTMRLVNSSACDKFWRWSSELEGLVQVCTPQRSMEIELEPRQNSQTYPQK